MVGPDPKVMGGIASVVTGYLNSSMVRDYDLKYISSHKDGSKIKKLMVAAAAYLRFTWICIFDRPDIIHIHSSFGASFYRKMIFIIIGKWFSIPIVNHIHGSEFDKFYTNSWYIKKRLVTNIYQKCDVIIVLSKEWKNRFGHAVKGINIKVVENFAAIF
jgi:glycosyltransferase involved in cell wall biosynthesis